MVKFYRFLNKLEEKFHLGTATIIIAVLTLLSRLTGFLRDLLLASELGLSRQTDIYFTAFRIPDLIYNFLILGTLSAAFIPVFTSYYLKDKKEAWVIANSVLNFAVIFMGLVAVVMMIFTEPLMKLVAPGFSAVDLQETVALTRILLISPIIFTLSSVLSSTLLSFKKFIWVNTAPLLYNAGILFGIVFLLPRWGLKGLAVGVIMGAILHVLIQVPQIIGVGWKWSPIISWGHVGVKKIISLVIPRILGLDISYINLIIVSVIGSTLTAGTIAAFNFANNIQAVPLGIFALSTAMAVFPVLSEHYAKKQITAFIEAFDAAFVRILYLILPMSVLILLLRAHIVRLLLGYGECDWTCTITTFDALGVLSFALIAQSLVPLLSRAFYARQNTKLPVAIGLVCIAVNAVLSFYLSQGLGIIGVTMGFVIASLLQLGLLMIYLHKHIKRDLKNNNIVRESDYYIASNTSKILVACLISGAVAYGSLYVLALIVDTHTVLGIFLQAGLASVISGISYLYITDKFAIPDAVKIKAGLSKMGQFFNVTGV